MGWREGWRGGIGGREGRDGIEGGRDGGRDRREGWRDGIEGGREGQGGGVGWKLEECTDNQQDVMYLWAAPSRPHPHPHPRPHPHPYRNYYLIFGLISETCLAVALAFCPGVSSVFRLHGLRWVGRGVACISEG